MCSSRSLHCLVDGCTEKPTTNTLLLTYEYNFNTFIYAWNTALDPRLKFFSHDRAHARPTNARYNHNAILIETNYSEPICVLCMFDVSSHFRWSAAARRFLASSAFWNSKRASEHGIRLFTIRSFRLRSRSQPTTHQPQWHHHSIGHQE